MSRSLEPAGFWSGVADLELGCIDGLADSLRFETESEGARYQQRSLCRRWRLAAGDELVDAADKTVPVRKWTSGRNGHGDGWGVAGESHRPTASLREHENGGLQSVPVL